MIIKQVKEYSKRKRIEINKTDNIDAGEKVYIFKVNEYNQIMENLQALESENKTLQIQHQQMQNQETNIKEMLENATSHIYDNHQKEVENKDNEIKQLKQQINVMRKSISHYIIQLSSLGLLDIIRRKQNKIIENMNDAIFHDADDDAIADAKKIE